MLPLTLANLQRLENRRSKPDAFLHQVVSSAAKIVGFNTSISGSVPTVVSLPPGNGTTRYSVQGDGRCNVALGDHDLIRRALNARKDMLQLCVINPDTKLQTRYVIGGAKKTDRLNGEKVKKEPDYDFMFGGW